MNIYVDRLLKGETAVENGDNKNSNGAFSSDGIRNTAAFDEESVDVRNYDEVLDSVTSTMKAVGAKTLTDGETVKVRKSKGFCERLVSSVSGGVKHSIAAKVLTSYSEHDTSENRAERSGRGLFGNMFHRLSVGFSKGVADSSLVSALGNLPGKLLTLRLKVFGAFFATFGIYIFVYYLLDNFFMTDKRGILDILFGFSMTVLSVPLLLSTETLSSALCNSAFGHTVKNVAGIHTVSISKKGAWGRANFGFAAGVAASVLAMLTSPGKTVFLITSLAVSWLIFSKPEFGVVVLAFLIPFVGSEVLLLCIAVTVLAFALKLIRRKRFLSFEMLDISVFAVLVIVLFAFVGSPFENSVWKSLYYAAMLVPYFLTINLMKNRLWLERVVCAFVLGASVSSGMCGLALFADKALDGASEALAELFSDSALSDALTGNVETLALLCICAVPLAVSLLLSPSVKARKFHSAISVILLVLTVVVGGIPGGAIALSVSLLTLFVTYSEKALLIPVFTALALPAVSFVLPKLTEILAEFFIYGTGKITDAHLHEIRETLASLSKNIFGGVGFGFAGAHNGIQSTYGNILVKTGIVGLAVFGVFIWLFIASSLKIIDRTGNFKKSPALRSCGVRINTPDSLGTYKSSKKNGANRALTLSQYCISRKIGIASPLCSVLSLLICAVYTDIFANEITFLVFWTASSICAAYVRTTRRDINDIESSYIGRIDPITFSQADIGIR